MNKQISMNLKGIKIISESYLENVKIYLIKIN